VDRSFEIHPPGPLPLRKEGGKFFERGFAPLGGLLPFGGRGNKRKVKGRCREGGGWEKIKKVKNQKSRWGWE
jgi:hypothetical protein